MSNKIRDEDLERWDRLMNELKVRPSISDLLFVKGMIATKGLIQSSAFRTWLKNWASYITSMEVQLGQGKVPSDRLIPHQFGEITQFTIELTSQQQMRLRLILEAADRSKEFLAGTMKNAPELGTATRSHVDAMQADIDADRAVIAHVKRALT